MPYGKTVVMLELLNMPESPLSESSVQYLFVFSILTDLALEEGSTASGDIMWEEVRDTESQGTHRKLSRITGFLWLPLPSIPYPAKELWPEVTHLNSCENCVFSLKT